MLPRQPIAEVPMVMLCQVDDMAYHTRRDSELLGNILVALPIHERHVSDPDLVIELQFRATAAPFPKSWRNIMLILSRVDTDGVPLLAEVTLLNPWTKIGDLSDMYFRGIGNGTVELDAIFP